MSKSRSKVLAAAAMTVFVFILSTGTAPAEGAGQLDPTFGRNLNDDIPDGVVSISLGYGNDYATDLAIGPDGKIFVVGHISNGQSNDIVVLSYSEDGLFDQDFGAGDDDGTPDGVARFSLGEGDDFANAVTVQADGKVIVAGHHDAGASTTMFALRTNPDGTLDPAFGTAGDGIVRVSLGDGDDIARDIALQSDGKILLVGDSIRTDGRSKIIVARLNSDGSPDTSFGQPDTSAQPGVVLTSLDAGDDFVDAVALQEDGKIVVTGHHTAKDGTSDLFVARYDASGALDVSFGAGNYTLPGIVTLSLSDGADIVRDVALQNDGTIVLLADSLAADGSTHVIGLRLTADGNLDETFGGENGANSDGLVTPFSNLEHASGAAIAVQVDGKLVMLGTGRTGKTRKIAVMRYDANGAIDQSFSQSFAKLSLGEGDQTASALVVQAGALIVAGAITSATQGAANIAVLRLRTPGN